MPYLERFKRPAQELYEKNRPNELKKAKLDVEGNKLKKGYEFVNNQYGDIVQRKKSKKFKTRMKQLGSYKVTEDPDDIYARMTRMEFDDYVKNYREFEEEQLELAQTDTSLIDQARQDSDPMSRTNLGDVARGAQERNRERYGVSLNSAQQSALANTNRMGSALNQAQTMNDARLAQEEANRSRLAQLIDIGQGVNSSAQDQMGGAAADATQRKNAYTQARAQHKAQTYSTLGSLGGMGVAFLMGF